MIDEPTLPQVQQIRELLFAQYSSHWQQCPVCQHCRRCVELDRQLLVQAKWAMIGVRLQTFDRESEEAS